MGIHSMYIGFDRTGLPKSGRYSIKILRNAGGSTTAGGNWVPKYPDYFVSSNILLVALVKAIWKYIGSSKSNKGD